MKKYKIFDKKRLMSNTTAVMAILVAAVLVSSSAVSAVDFSSDQVQVKMKNEEIITIDSGTVDENKNEDIDVDKYLGDEITGLPPPEVRKQVAASLEESSIRGDYGLKATDNNPRRQTDIDPMFYAYNAYDPGGEPNGPINFTRDDPVNVTFLNTTKSGSFIAGGTYTCDGRWIGTEYYGQLWEISTKNGSMKVLGGGGANLNALAQDPIYNRVYGLANYNQLFEVDPWTGAQTFIGTTGLTWPTYAFIGMDFSANNTLWAWTVSYYGLSQLWTIDTVDGKGTHVGDMDLFLLYAQDGDIDRDTDLLWLTGYTSGGGGRVYTVNLSGPTFGESTEIGPIGEDGLEATGSCFIQTCPVPEHDIEVVEIISPEDRAHATPEIPMKIRVKNNGEHDETDVDFQMQIIKCEDGPDLMPTEDFSGSTFPPAGWSTNYWRKYYSNNAGGTSPEAGVWYAYQGYYNYENNITTKKVNATGFEKVSLTFKFGANVRSNYEAYFRILFRKNATAYWDDVTPWENPLTEDSQAAYIVGCYGWGEDLGEEFQVKFQYVGYYYNFEYFYLDDVRLVGCTGCAEYADLVQHIDIDSGEEMEIEFEPWTPSEWNNASYQNVWEEYPIQAFSLFKDQRPWNDDIKKPIDLYMPYFNDTGATAVIGPQTGPGQTFPVTVEVTNLGQKDVCCFWTTGLIGTVVGRLLTEDFSEGIDDWEETPWDHWVAWPYNYAGGEPPEARFYYYPYVPYYQWYETIFYYGPMDTSGFTEMDFEFKSYIYSFYYGWRARVVTSTDGVNWNYAPEFYRSGGSHGPETVQFKMDTSHGIGSSTYYIGFSLYTYMYYVYYWYLDDVYLTNVSLAPEWDDEKCVLELAAGETVELVMDDWTPEAIAARETDYINYLVTGKTDLQEPVDQNPFNDEYAREVYLSYWHDIGVKEFNSPIESGRAQDVIFEQLPISPGDPGFGPFSDAGQGPGYRCYENFWDLTDKIGDVHWWGLWAYGTGQPTEGDEFEIAFCEDDGGNPDFNNLEYVSEDLTLGDEVTYTSTGDYYWGYECYYCQVDLPEAVPMTEGWITVFKTTINSQRHAWLDAKAGSGDGKSYQWNIGQRTFDLSMQLTAAVGMPSPDVFLPLDATSDLEATVINLGTFSAEDLSCEGELRSWITDWENGTLLYNTTITGIDLDPLGGEHFCDFGSWTFDEEGIYGLTANVSEPAEGDDYPGNNDDQWGIGVDDTDPVTTHVYVPATPDGDNGWHVTNVEVTVTSNDPVSTNVSSGVDFIKYKIGTGSWQTIEGDGMIEGTFIVDVDAENLQVEYYAVDNVGNEETHHTFQIDMDQTKPVIADVTWEAFKQDGDWWVRFTCNATDATSGMDRVEFFIADTEYEIVTGGGPTYEFEIMWSTAFEKLTLWFYHYDEAGNMEVDDVPGKDIVAAPYAQQQQQYQQKQPLG